MDIELEEFQKEITNLNRLEQISIYIEKLKNNNFNVRLFCVKRLDQIAELLGPIRTEDELIPLLIDLIINFEDNDEVLIEISNQFINLIEYITSKNNIAMILKGLELLAGNDDEIVRQQATENLCKLIKNLDENLITNEIFPLMQRLIQNDMKSKVSCCYLFPVVYPTLNNEQIKKELIQAFHEISRDDSPSVRRAAAHNIKNFALIDDSDLLKELQMLHSDLMKDNIDIVKVFAIESTQNLLMKLSIEDQKNLIANFNSVVNKDRSWRVKYAAAETICEVSKFFDYTFNEQNFLPVIMMLLKDPEPEVRSSVVSKIDLFANFISPQKFINNILPIFQDSISNDHNHHVRSLFATSIVKCCKYFTNDNFEKLLFPLVNKIIKDDVIEVRNSALQNLEELQIFFKNENLMINCLLPTILECSNDLKWRVRLTLAEKILLLAERCPKDIFISYFLPIVNNFFSDHASQIREVAIQIFNKLCSDSSEFIQTVWTLQKTNLSHTNYILRISSLNSIDLLKNYYDNEFLIDSVFPSIFSLKNDNVPNVKFSLSNLIKSIFTFLYSNSANKIRFSNSLKEAKIILIQFVKEDLDIDVKFFSQEAIDILNKLN